MTGRELILYILENGLENEPVVKNGKVMGFKSIGEVAEKLNVGVATIYTWIGQGWLDCVIIGDTVFIPATFKSPLANFTD